MMFFVACHHTDNNTQLLSYNGKYPDESTDSMELVVSDSGLVSFVITTPLFNSYHGDSSYTECPKGVTAVSYTEWGDPQAKLSAQYACNINNTTYRASNNVIIIDLLKHDTLETEEIIWDQRKRIIYSKVLVKQKKADGSVNYGDGFEADERFSKYTITHPRGEMYAVDF